VTSSIRLAGITLALAFAAVAAAPAKAAPHDGRWSVLVITETGNCDQAYRYEVAVGDGKVSYAGREQVSFSGTVAGTGAVKVNIRLGEQGATGSGKLSGSSGAGTWQGTGSAGACAGRWEAEKR
jgi:hypothetical protein